LSPQAAVLVWRPASALSQWLGWCFVSTSECWISDDVYLFEAPCWAKAAWLSVTILRTLVGKHESIPRKIWRDRSCSVYS
jgi:hypothetical protein